MLAWVLLLACGPLWRLGGWGKEDGNPVPWTGWRDTLIPLIFGIYFGYVTFWWLGAITAGTMLIIRMGYGENSNLQKHLHLSNFQARLVCGPLYVLIGSLPLAIYTWDWAAYIKFAILSAAVNHSLVRRWVKDTTTELTIGWVIGLAPFIFKLVR